MLKTKYDNKKIILIIVAGVIAVSIAALFMNSYRIEPTIAVATEEKDLPAVPILMYHSVCNNKKVVSDYRISPEQFERDIEYLHKKGYNSIFVSDLVAYVYEGTPLPDKPVVLTFDDGYLNNMTYVLPILEKFDMCATVSVVGEFAEQFSKISDSNPLYAYLTWNDIRAMSATERIEIGNHTYAMHEIGERKGCAKISGESVEKYDEALTNDLERLQNALLENSGTTPIVFAYPYGFISEESLPVIKKLGFLAALTCYEHINYIDGTAEQLYRLGRFNRTPNISTESFMKKIGI